LASEIDRRSFLSLLGAGVPTILLPGCLRGSKGPVVTRKDGTRFLNGWFDPPAEFSQAPFWFLNDKLSEAEIVRQLDDFRAHGVYGFVIHPRAGLPRSIGWMSDRMIHFMRVAIDHAIKRGMWVVLYDEGMYPSGSSCGQVVAENPAFRTRGLFAIDLDTAKPGTKEYGVSIGHNGKPELVTGQHLVAIVKRKTNGHRLAVIDRAMLPGRSVIRGLHFVEEDPPRRANHKEVPEDLPPAADILNPKAVECFIRLVYKRYHDEFGEHFGQGIRAIFTDEPSLLAKNAEKGAVPGTTGILEYVNSWLGYDFTPYLPALWHKDEPDADQYRRDYHRAIQGRLEETFYSPISKWCDAHGIALTGHPAGPDGIGHLRYFHIPGQDIVWRYIEPGKPSALEGAQSTQAKCASSAMIHLGRRRNSNEYCGAYGHDFTFEEMKWLTNWLVVRGCNMLYPHAFYYSIRGPRIDERPPDVGPNSPWWEQYKPYADSCRRLCWLNTDSKHVCSLAILGRNDYLPWRSAKVCFRHQRDFNYLEARHLWEDARVTTEGIYIAGMYYRALIIEDEPPGRAKAALRILDDGGRLIRWREGMSDSQFVWQIDRLVPVDVRVSPMTPELRVRHVTKYGTDCYILFNEGQEDIDVRLHFSAKGQRFWLDAETGRRDAIDTDRTVYLARHEVKILMVDES
jgi:hypothetical protein